MTRRMYSIALMLILTISACNLPTSGAPGTIPTAQPGGGPITTPGPGGDVASTLASVKLPPEFTRFPPPPIITITKSAVQIEGESFDAYLIPGDRLRLVCRQPCEMAERIIDALYASYKVTAEQDVRTAGINILDSLKMIDIHLNRDKNCTRNESELGLTGSYPDDPNKLFICLYLTDPDLQADPLVPFTPEGAARAGGLGVFAHEYVHAILWGRFASSHDFVFPIEYATLNPSKPEYGNLCDPVYQYGAPLTYQLCKSYGLTFDQLIQSLLDVDRLYQGGYGNQPHKEVGYNQYRAVLDHILGGDSMPAFAEAGYQKLFVEEGTANYTLPWANEPCTYRAALVSDVTVPLGTLLDAGASFKKTWRIRNTGSCAWEGVQLVFARGEAMATTTSVPVAATSAGNTVDVSVAMAIPAEAGVHTGEWRLRSASGQDFGPVIDLTLYARPGCTLPPQLTAFAASPAAIGPGALSLLSWGQVTNVDNVEILGLGEVDPNGDRLLVQPKGTTTYTLQATCGEKTATSQTTVAIDPDLPPFAISALTASADPAHFSGPCSPGEEIRFSAKFVSNAPGVILYRWDASNGGTSDPRLFVIENAGSQIVTTSWRLSSSSSGWMAFKILAPQESEAVRANFSLICTP